MIGYLLSALFGASIFYLWKIRPVGLEPMDLDRVEDKIDQDLIQIETESNQRQEDLKEEYQDFADTVAKEISQLDLGEQADHSRDLLGLSKD